MKKFYQIYSINTVEIHLEDCVVIKDVYNSRCSFSILYATEEEALEELNKLDKGTYTILPIYINH